ncbi:MAG: PqqD family protein [Phycisphaerae bacterium]
MPDPAEQSGLTEEQLAEILALKPSQAPALSALPGGAESLTVTVEVPRIWWQRLLGLSRLVPRSFTLDRHGRFVYEQCNGTKPVRSIVNAFSRQFDMAKADARIRVITFLQTLIHKGLVVLND